MAKPKKNNQGPKPPRTDGVVLSWNIGPRKAGSDLGHFLQDKIEAEFSFRQIKSMLEKGCGRVNGEIERYASRKLRPRDRVQFLVPHDLEVKSGPVYLELSDVLYRDDYFVVVSKPSGVAVTLDRDSRTVSKAIEYFAQKLGVEKLMLAHRLDRETSGALILTFDGTVQRQFFEMFKKRAIHKAYEALVNGKVGRKKGQYYSRIDKISDKGGQGIWGSVKNGGREALTEYSVIDYRYGVSHLRLFPKTGRTHQIRVHLSEAGHPILGDTLYGRNAKWNKTIVLPKRQMLHARGLIFRHPVTQKSMAVEAPLPADFKEILGIKEEA